MDELDIFVLFAMDDGENDRNNALRFIFHELIIESLPQVDELEVRERGQRATNQNYYEIIIPQNSDLLFKEYFKMSRATFKNLANIIGHAIPGNPNYFTDIAHY